MIGMHRNEQLTLGITKVVRSTSLTVATAIGLARTHLIQIEERYSKAASVPHLTYLHLEFKVSEVRERASKEHNH